MSSHPAPSGERERFDNGPWSIALAAIVIAIALFSSGAAGLVNQVVWQRSLKVFLGGGETTSSTVVVLVFMAGLGIGSFWMGRRTRRLANPLLTFGYVEGLLAIVNLGVCGLLASDLTSSVSTLQRIAASVGVPLLVPYACLAILLLAIPCLLMGATMPLAAESCQRNLGLKNSRLIGLLFFVNTVGSIAGAVLSSGYMIPYLGLTLSLSAAVGMNLVAGALLLLLARNRQEVPMTDEGRSAQVAATKSQQHNSRRLTAVLALGLGFCSLGYEMYLFRLVPLRHEPLPFTFAAVLAGFLAFWSLGAALSSMRRGPSIAMALRICGLLCCATIPMFVLDTKTPIYDTGSLVEFVLLKSAYFLPCVGFGYLFGRVTADAAASWGNDVGRIYAWNTVGSCAGILFMTFIGYEIPFFSMVLVIGLLMFAMQEYVSSSEEHFEGKAPTLARWLAPVTMSTAVVLVCFVFDVSNLLPGQRMYSGRDGVIILKDDGDMIWDGLWHSRISMNGDHVGSNNWSAAVFPVMCHPTGRIKDVCVIGTGTGITPGTFAKSSAVERIDSYDICHELKNLYRDFPEGTLNVARDPKINLLWQDARSGMALNSKKYDIIQTQPLYLIQAGSSLLNSVEFYQLISSRLNPGGVFSLYSNGSPEQAFVVRETADQVFRYRESFMNGYLLLMSNSPIVVDEATLTERYQQQDVLWDEIRAFHRTATVAAALDIHDSFIAAGDRSLVITDDRPIVEYPGYLQQAIQSRNTPLNLPRPQSNRYFGVAAMSTVDVQ